MNPLLESFINEAREIIETASETILALESHPDDSERLDELFRGMHTLKGASGMLENMQALHRLVHVTEDGLDRLRDGEFTLSSDYTDLLFEVLDQLNVWLDQLEQDETLSDDAPAASKALIARLESWTPGSGGDSEGGSAEAPGDDTPRIPDWVAALPAQWREEAIAAATGAADEKPVTVVYTPGEEAFYEGQDPLALVAGLPGLIGFDIDPQSPWPESFEMLDPYSCLVRFRVLAVAVPTAITAYLERVIEQCEWHEIDPAALQGGDDSPSLESLFDQAQAEADGATNDDEASLEALFDEIAAAGDHAESAAAPAGAADPTPPPGAASGDHDAEIAALFNEQLKILQIPTGDEQRAGRLQTVTRVLHGMLTRQGRRDELPKLERAHAQALKADDEAPLVAFLRDLPGVEDMPDASDEATPAASRAGKRPSRPEASGGSEDKAGSTSDSSSSDSSKSDSSTPARSTEESAPAQDRRPLRVEQHRIDELMTLAGELIVAKNALPFLARRIEDGERPDELVRELKVNQANLDRIASRIQNAVMSARMVPLSTVFQRFPRLVRDLSRQLGKKIELITDGEEAEADKNVIGGLADPLTHLVRNSLDHAIEMPEERTAAGKPETGRIELSARTLDDRVVLELRDDGRGIDPAAIKHKAWQKGLIDEQRLEALSDEEALHLILLPGFSTADQVSDLSGRGVGMDAVQDAIRRIGGRLEIRSTVGEGTTMRILLPLSMAVARVLLVEIDDQCYGIPMSMIRETVRLPRSAFNRVKQSELIALRDELIPVHRSRQLLGATPAPQSDDEAAVLILEVENQSVGLVVDEFRQGVDIVQKPMEGIMAQYDIFSGSALTGDGQVLLVLNVPTLLRHAATSGTETARPAMIEEA